MIFMIIMLVRPASRRKADNTLRAGCINRVEAAMLSSTLLRAAVRHQAKNTLRQPRDKKRAESTDRLPALFRLLIRLVFQFVIPGTVAAASIIFAGSFLLFPEEPWTETC